MTLRAFALVVSMLLPMAAVAADIPGPLALAKKQVETADYRMAGHLVRVDEKGTRTSYGVSMRAHWFPGILRVLFDVVSPADARVQIGRAHV